MLYSIPVGSFYTSLHVRSEDREAVVNAVKTGPVQMLPAYVSTESVNGWVSVFPEATEGQDQQLLQNLATALSKQMNTAVFGMLVHDSDIFWYVLCETGKVSDLYDSDPGYFSGAPMPPRGGDSKKLSKYCLPNTSILELNGILHTRPEQIFKGDYLAEQIGKRLGLPNDFYSMGFKYIGEEKEEREEDDEEELENVELISRKPTRDTRFLSVVSEEEESEEEEQEENEPGGPISSGLVREPITGGEVIAGPLKFKIPAAWIGSVRKSPTGDILQIKKESTDAEVMVAVFTAEVRYPIIPLDTILQQRITQLVGTSEVESEPEFPLIYAGIRFRIKRFTAHTDKADIYGLIATGDSGKSRLLMVDAKTNSEADLDEVQNMLTSVERM